MSDDPDIRFDLAFEEAAGSLDRLSPLVRRIVAPNPSPMTFKGTCAYVVGHGAVAVIDPGPELPAHIESLLRGLGDERVAQILVTHTHRDHSPGARLLQARRGADHRLRAARQRPDTDRGGGRRDADVERLRPQVGSDPG